ncbi:MAG: bifunctional (p)ppGpp synthetase/guanosine-3',5'-bis(diphosphate) 3'-pyrophosphohydrolase [Alphaproteobacteria bacterium]|nr:bifunctional (p)ppGpp synthetase/guanosine-3',5'-bis(diphosphate) 3'-pyrophosphohydrolase [Alphaproteobacteria bacterium]
MIRQYELVERVLSYDKKADEDLLNRAYVFSMQAHGAQLRASGDPYFSHPLEVAGILADLKLDSATIITALLHDIVEDTSYSIEDIERQFGKEIARLVDGVTKLSRIELPSDKSRQAENFRKLVLAMSEDIRVLLVKLADRLHNMRTLHHKQDPEKRKKIAVETFEIYAPLAERIGIHQIKDELEDLAFAQTNPEARDSIIKRLSYLREKGENLIPRIIQSLQDVMNKSDVHTNVFGREKSPFSIWKKTQHKNIAFEELCDIIAFRIIVPSIEECYKALGVIHSQFPVLPGRFKDYISTPKPNGYQSIHTSIIGPEQHRIEVQIRTQEMHEISEWGVAAHWRYKSDDNDKDSKWQLEGKQYRWLQELINILEEASGAEEFLEHTRMEMFQDQVFCFSPKGDLIALPKGSTPVDFAFAVHSEIGKRCVGARINGRLLPLKTVLHNGDQIEIITSKTQTPSPDWEKFVITGKAKATIRRYIRNENRKQFVELGHSILIRAFKHANLPFSEKSVEEILPQFSQKSLDDLYFTIGENNLSAKEVLHAVFPDKKDAILSEEEKLAHIHPKERQTSKYAIPLKGLIPGMAVHYAGCCHPLPGDRIVGIVSTGKGVTIHTIDCETLEKFANETDRWLDVAWDESYKSEKFVGRLYLIISNRPNSLASVTTIIGKNNVNINNVKFTNRKSDFFEMIVDVEVEDLRQFNILMAALRASPVIHSVERARG